MGLSINIYYLYQILITLPALELPPPWVVSSWGNSTASKVVFLLFIIFIKVFIEKIYFGRPYKNVFNMEKLHCIISERDRKAETL